jgi:hypothetical protein
VITAQPTNLFLRPGVNATFIVSAFSPAPISYQWQLNGTNLLGATHATLTVSNVSLAHAGAYMAVVSDTMGSTLSSPANLTLLIDPVIVHQPCNVTVPQGGSVTLSVEVNADATLPMGYRWRRGSTTVAHAVVSKHVSFLTVTNCQSTTNYEVIVTNLARLSALRSSNVLVTVLADTNQNQMPDDWEAAYSLQGSLNPEDDLDGDGLRNLQEYEAGTDPTDALSYLKVENVELAEGRAEVLVRFLAVSNRTYTVQSSEAVAGGGWQRLRDVVAASTNRLFEVRDPAGAMGVQRYYRLVTPQVP